jgi:hypothetical protein
MPLKILGALLIVIAIAAIRFTTRRAAQQPMAPLTADLVAVSLTTLFLFGAAFIVFPPG